MGWRPWRSADVGASGMLISFGKEIDEQLVNALMLVVMHPMRRVGQALDAVEVGYVIVLGLGELGPEVVIALPPDNEGGRLYRAKGCCGALGEVRTEER